MNIRDFADWQKATPAANADATVTFAAVAGKRHHLIFVAYSYNVAPTGGKLTIEDAAGTIKIELDVTAAGEKTLPLSGEFIGSVNTALVVKLAAGGAAVSGKVNAAAYTAE